MELISSMPFFPQVLKFYYKSDPPCNYSREWLTLVRDSQKRHSSTLKSAPHGASDQEVSMSCIDLGSHLKVLRFDTLSTRSDMRAAENLLSSFISMSNFALKQRLKKLKLPDITSLDEAGMPT